MFTRLALLAIPCLLPLLPAQEPYLVKDLEMAARGTLGSNPKRPTVVGSKVFFIAEAPAIAMGTRVYAHDLKTGKTSRLAPGNPRDLVTDGARLFFFGQLAGKHYLFSSDGTGPGTRSIGALPGLSFWLTVVKDRLFFAASDAATGRELYTSDGIGKIELVMDIRKGSFGSSPSNLTASGDVLFFTADDGASGRELWRSEGSAKTTRRVADINPGIGLSEPMNLVSRYDASTKKHTLVFMALTPAHGTEPWISDGTAAGTRLIADVNPGTSSSLPSQFLYEPSSKQFYFAAENDAAGRELWRTTPSTKVGAVLVKDIYSGRGRSSPIIAGAHAGRVYLAADDGFHGKELWVSDGTAHGTKMVRDLVVGPSGGVRSLAIDGSGRTPRIYLSSWTAGLWISDGTGRGTRLVKTVWPGGQSWEFHSRTPALTPGGGVVFAADDGIHGKELWLSDGTAAGTRLAVDLDTRPDAKITASANPRVGLERLSTLAFVAKTASDGEKIWSSDGTENGTATGNWIRNSARDLTRMDNGTAYCTALDQQSGKHRLVRLGYGFASPATDVSNLLPIGGRLFFAGHHPTYGEELWILNGTASRVVKNIAQGRIGSQPRHLTRFQNDVYFIARRALWRSDGTDAGTTKLKDGARGPLVATENRVFFTGEQTASGRELWTTDGTAAGTKLVVDILPGTASSWPLAKIALGDTVLFTAVHPTAGRELWKSDGTAAGTVLVKDIYAGPKSTVVQHATRARERVFFSAFGAKNHQLWVTDGTTAGTIMLTPGIINARPDSIVVSRGREVWFSANSWQYGRELWSTDGTAAGTAVAHDFMPGRGSSNPEILGIVESDRVRLLFAADEWRLGRELFAIDLPGAARSLGHGCAHRRQPPVLWVEPTLSPLFTVAAFGGSRVRPNSSVFVFLSNKPSAVLPFAGCAFVVDPIFTVLGPYKPKSGRFRSSVFVKADPTHVGAQLAWQAVAWPAPGRRGFDLTNGVITTYWQ